MIDKFILSLRAEHRISKSTLHCYRQDLTYIFKAVKCSYDVLTKEQIKNYIANCFDKGNSAATVVRRLISLSKFYKWLIEEGFIQQNPAKDIKLPKIPYQVPVFLEEEEFVAFLDALRGLQNKKQKAVLFLLLFTGARPMEIVNLQKRDLSIERQSAILRGAKGGKDRLVYFNTETAKVVNKYLLSVKFKPEWLTRGKFVFDFKDTGYIKSVCKKLVSEAGIQKDINLRSLRHSFATWALNEGMTLKGVKEQLGHSDIKTTERYAHLSTKARKKEYNRVFK